MCGIPHAPSYVKTPQPISNLPAKRDFSRKKHFFENLASKFGRKLQSHTSEYVTVEFLTRVELAAGQGHAKKPELGKVGNILLLTFAKITINN